MAHLAEHCRPDRPSLQTAEQAKAWDHLAWVFGRRPSSLRSIADAGEPGDACIVKVDWGCGEGLEFVCAGGVLIGIPPKGKGQQGGK